MVATAVRFGKQLGVGCDLVSGAYTYATDRGSRGGMWARSGQGDQFEERTWKARGDVALLRLALPPFGLANFVCNLQMPASPRPLSGERAGLPR